MGTTWKAELAEIVRRNWGVGQRFTLDEVYRFEEHFKRLYPANNHVRQKLCEMMQKLRDEDRLVEFVDNQGTYRRIAE